MRSIAIIAALCVLTLSLRGAEEKIRGVLEKTVKPGACAQITDALADVYYVTKSDEAEKAVAQYVGKTTKVVITGTVETKEGDPAFFFNLKAVEAYAPKMPPPPPAPAISNATASATTGQPFNYQITAANGATSYTAAGLPAGLAVNATTGAITGTPTATGTFNVTMGATNAGGEGKGTLTLTVSAEAPKTEPKADTKTEPKPEPKAEAKTETKPEAKTPANK